MENVVLVVHLVLAVCLIGIVLLQKSEGGGLGMGGGGAMTGRGAATAVTKLTWAFAAAFLATSVTLTILAASDRATGSIVDLLPPGTEGGADAPLVPDAPGGGLLPPGAGDPPILPPRGE